MKRAMFFVLFLIFQDKQSFRKILLSIPGLRPGKRLPNLRAGQLHKTVKAVQHSLFQEFIRVNIQEMLLKGAILARQFPLLPERSTNYRITAVLK